MKFSVLLSVYKKEQPAYLQQSLDSLFNQTLLPNEVILVKDGPLTNELEEVIGRYTQMYPTLKVVSLLENQGLGKALNEGLKHCSYELVARMDTDDISLSDRFELQVKAFSDHPDVAVVGGWIDEFSSSPSIIEGSRRLPENYNEISRFAKSKNPLNHVTVMFRRFAVEDTGGYEDFYLLEDYWLWVRMLKQKYRFYNIQRTLVLVRGGVAMTARRGGFKYACSEIALFKRMRQMGLIGFPTYLKNIVIRVSVRLMPNFLRAFIYKKILRK